MRYFKDNNNEIWAYEDYVSDLEIPKGLIPLTQKEFDELTSPSEEELLLQAKALKKEEIEQKRDEAIEQDIEFNGEIFSNKKTDRDAISSFLSSNLPKDFAWIAKSNALVPMNKKALADLASLMFAKVNENTIKARRLKDRVEESSTLEEVETIKWD